jgi:hypothetical protein
MNVSGKTMEARLKPWFNKCLFDFGVRAAATLSLWSAAGPLLLPPLSQAHLPARRCSPGGMNSVWAASNALWGFQRGTPPSTPAKAGKGMRTELDHNTVLLSK